MIDWPALLHVSLKCRKFPVWLLSTQLVSWAVFLGVFYIHWLSAHFIPLTTTSFCSFSPWNILTKKCHWLSGLRTYLISPACSCFLKSVSTLIIIVTIITLTANTHWTLSLCQAFFYLSHWTPITTTWGYYPSLNSLSLNVPICKIGVCKMMKFILREYWVWESHPGILSSKLHALKHCPVLSLVSLLSAFPRSASSIQIIEPAFF